MAGMALREAMWVQRTRPLAFWLLAVLVAASIGVLLAAKPAHAATFTVNRTGDESEPVANQGDGGCDALPSTAGNQCSLRAAIQEANANNNEPTVVDLIRFNIVSSASVKTISPSSQLPTITETVTINGYTQPGASPNTDAAGNNAVLKIQLNGTNAGDFTHGLAITASNSTIKGLVINRFKRFGILIEDFQIENADARANKVQGNFIGTNAKGSAALGNFGGVRISSTEATTVGGTTAGARNIISGNFFTGVFIEEGGGSTGNKVQGNFIGTNADGTAALDTPGEGVLISSAPSNTIGGTTRTTPGGPCTGACNVISGNNRGGVEINGPGAARNTVEGNFIGTNADGTAALGNTEFAVGVRISSGAPNNTVGGTAAGARNIISGNQRGVQISDEGASRNKVQGNFIGTDANGSVAIGNTEEGVLITGSASNNTVGGTTSGEGNRIAHNGDDGVLIFTGTGNSVLSNQIFANAGLGIDLGNVAGDGVTNNDTDDPDTGANNLQNFPLITSATRSATTPFPGATTISGTLNSNPNQTYTIQCFVAGPGPFVATTDDSDHGEGQILVAQTTATTDANGDDSFSCVSPVPQVGQAVTATATNTATGDTSEFSENVVVSSGP
jgi:CSLREA domain-containing protein